MTNINEIFWLNAKDMAVPRNGAEQGVASRTANIPDKKLGTKIFFFASAELIFLLIKLLKNCSKVISKIPIRLAIKKTKIIIRKIRK